MVFGIDVINLLWEKHWKFIRMEKNTFDYTTNTHLCEQLGWVADKWWFCIFSWNSLVFFQYAETISKNWCCTCRKFQSISRDWFYRNKNIIVFFLLFMSIVITLIKNTHFVLLQFLPLLQFLSLLLHLFLRWILEKRLLLLLSSICNRLEVWCLYTLQLSVQTSSQNFKKLLWVKLNKMRDAQ